MMKSNWPITRAGSQLIHTREIHQLKTMSNIRCSARTKSLITKAKTFTPNKTWVTIQHLCSKVIATFNLELTQAIWKEEERSPIIIWTKGATWLHHRCICRIRDKLITIFSLTQDGHLRMQWGREPNRLIVSFNNMTFFS